jgi:hypothetical protein
MQIALTATTTCLITLLLDERESGLGLRLGGHVAAKRHDRGDNLKIAVRVPQGHGGVSGWLMPSWHLCSEPYPQWVGDLNDFATISLSASRRMRRRTLTRGNRPDYRHVDGVLALVSW